MKANLRTIASYPVILCLGIFILTLLIIWLPFAVPMYWWLRRDPNLTTIVIMGLLFGAFLILLPFWGQIIHQQKRIFRHYGLSTTQSNRLALHQGLVVGLLATLALFAVEGYFGWLAFQPPTLSLPKIVFEGLLCGLGVAFAEELFFRGWLWDELRRDYAPSTAVWAVGLIFASLHFLQPLEQMIDNALAFPGLVLMGMVMVWAKQKAGGLLGLPIGIHGGMVWGFYILDIGNLFQYTGKVPAWVTTVNGHPFAGIMGLLALSLLAWWLKFSMR